MQYARAFGGLFLRDLHVLRREFFPFVIRVCMNPLLFLFVFTYRDSAYDRGRGDESYGCYGGRRVQHGVAAWADGGGDHVQRDCGGGAAAWRRSSG